MMDALHRLSKHHGDDVEVMRACATLLDDSSCILPRESNCRTRVSVGDQ